MNHLNLEEFERKIAYTFSDKNLLILALTHSSYANETKKGSHENNERLEFLGDAVLDMVVSGIYVSPFPEDAGGRADKAARGGGLRRLFGGAFQKAWRGALLAAWQGGRKHRRQKQRFHSGGCL